LAIGDGEHYVILGRPESGYSMKVRAAMRFKGVAHEWIDRGLRNEKLFQAHASVQLIPLVFLPDGTATQDSTPILEGLEETYPEPSFHPEEPATRFLSDVLEEYGDEWVNKLMFHHRWGYKADQRHRSGTLARGMLEGHPLRVFSPIVACFVVRRMVPRMAFAGANENNAPLLIESFRRLVGMLEIHLSTRPYLFGGRPAFGDFGLWGQLHQASIDPTCGAYMREHSPRVLAWIDRMLEARVEGDFERLSDLEESLLPIYAREVARFLCWDAANADAWETGRERCEVSMEGRLYFQKTFKYPAHGFAILREKFAEVADDAELREFLDRAGCVMYLE